MPARPITFSFFALSMILAVALGGRADREPSRKLPMISASFSLSLPKLGWKSTSTPRSLKMRQPGKARRK